MSRETKNYPVRKFHFLWLQTKLACSPVHCFLPGPSSSWSVIQAVLCLSLTHIPDPWWFFSSLIMIHAVKRAMSRSSYLGSKSWSRDKAVVHSGGVTWAQFSGLCTLYNVVLILLIDPSPGCWSLVKTVVHVGGWAGNRRRAPEKEREPNFVMGPCGDDALWDLLVPPSRSGLGCK